MAVITHIDDDTSLRHWNSLCGRIRDSGGVSESYIIEYVDDYEHVMEHSHRNWCSKCVNHPRLPLLIIANTDL